MQRIPNAKVVPVPSPMDMRILTLDIETDSLEWYREPHNRIVSYSARDHAGEFTDMLVYHPEATISPNDALQQLQNLIDQHDVVLGANIKFDLVWLLANDIDFTSKKVLDISQIEYRLSGQTLGDPSLENMAQKYLGIGKVEGLDFKNHRASTYPAELLLTYNHQDVALTYDVWAKQWGLVEADNLERILYIDHSTIYTLAHVETLGFKFDEDLATKYREDAQTAYDQAEKTLLDLVDSPIVPNFGSGPQLRAVLFGGSLKYEDQDYKEYTLKSREKYTHKEWTDTDRSIRCGGCGDQLNTRDDVEYLCTCGTVRYQCSMTRNRNIVYNVTGEHEHIKRRLVKVEKQQPIKGLGFGYKHLPTTPKYKELCREARDIGQPKPTLTTAYVKTDKDAIACLQAKTPNQKKFLDTWELYNNLSTCLDNFLSKYPEVANVESDGKALYTNFNTARTRTGRLSSSGMYNAQQIPSRAAEGIPKIKKIFTPRSGFDGILDFDYSGQEIVVLANLTNDQTLIHELVSGLDMHRQNAAELIYHCDPAEITKDQRSVAKGLTFSLSYGSTAHGLANDRNMNMNLEQAENAIDRFYGKYIGVSKAHDIWQSTVSSGDKFGRHTLRMPTGEFFLFDNPHSTVTKQKNYPIQGSSATITKVAINLIHKELVSKGYKSRIALSVHDSIVLQYVDDEFWEVVDLVKRCMTKGVEDFYKLFFGLTFAAPLGVEAEYGTNYGCGISVYVGAKAKKGEQFLTPNGMYEAVVAIDQTDTDLNNEELWKKVNNGA